MVLLLVAACLLAAAPALLAAIRDRPATPPSTTAASARALASAREHRHPLLLFSRLDRRGTPGRVMLARPDRPAGVPIPTPLRCDRVDFAGGRGLCLTRGSRPGAGYEAQVLGSDLRVRHALAVGGVPSRARVSPDGHYGSVTLFVAGESYAAAGAYSTQTTLIDLATGSKIADLEQFAVTRGSHRVTAADVNFWGVTFARSSDRFYATLATAGRTYLVEGSVRDRTMRTIHDNVECPSLSPDDTRIVYKKRVGRGTTWRLTEMDLATMHETPLAETRSVDDQVQWLDLDHVLYGVDGEVRVVRADGGGSPRRLLPGAASPAIVRWMTPEDRADGSRSRSSTAHAR